MFLGIALKDVFRPVFGLIMVQPPMIMFFLLTSVNWWDDYLNVGWPLNIMVTIWLIPCYAFYETLWNRYYQKHSYSPSDT